MMLGEDLLGAFMSRDLGTFHDPSFDINVFGSVPPRVYTASQLLNPNQP